MRRIMSELKSPYFTSTIMETRLRRPKRELSNTKDSHITDQGQTVKQKKVPRKSKSTFSLEDYIKNIPASSTELTCGFERYRDDFYNVPCIELAKKLLGQILVRQLDTGALLKARIVETESYPGGDDKASHSFQGRCTERNYPSYMKPGTTYVYLTYGMYHCINISSLEPGGCILLRALEPLEGTSYMETFRYNKRSKPKSGGTATETKSKQLKVHELCNGPSKLCISFDIGRDNCNVKDLCSWSGMWIEPDKSGMEAVKECDIVACPRIGIESVGGEWVLKPYRFYIIDNIYVSRKDKKKENEMKRQ